MLPMIQEVNCCYRTTLRDDGVAATVMQSVEEQQERLTEQQEQHTSHITTLQQQQQTAAPPPAAATVPQKTIHSLQPFPMLPDSQDMMISSESHGESFLQPVRQFPSSSNAVTDRRPDSAAAPAALVLPQLPFSIPETAAMTPSAADDWGNGEKADLDSFAATDVQQQLEELQQRLAEIEAEVQESKPLDSMTVGAVEARLSILEDDYAERRRDADDLELPVRTISGQLQLDRQC